MDNLNKIINIKSRKHFQETLQNYPNLIIVFTAKWCGLCNYIKPILQRINREISEVQIITINVDRHKGITEEFNVMAMPTLFAFKNGKQLKGEIDEHLDELNYSELTTAIKKKFNLS